MGTVPGHELVHRKKKKFDMEMGNWLLAFSWDCAFAVEHVYGHHKNVVWKLIQPLQEEERTSTNSFSGQLSMST